jgi:hypothetical protein
MPRFWLSGCLSRAAVDSVVLNAFTAAPTTPGAAAGRATWQRSGAGAARARWRAAVSRMRGGRAAQAAGRAEDPMFFPEQPHRRARPAPTHLSWSSRSPRDQARPHSRSAPRARSPWSPPPPPPAPSARQPRLWRSVRRHPWLGAARRGEEGEGKPWQPERARSSFPRWRLAREIA